MAAYGRLDVFFPDGLFKTYLLTDPNTTIGRSNTSTIPIDDETLSRYHVNITLKNSVVYIADMESENGTFIDGSRLESNTATELSGGEEIMIGDLRMIFATLDDSPTRPIEVPEETTQRVDLPDAEFYIEIADSYQTVAPGAHISTRVSITNEGEKTERFAIEVTGLPREWLRIDKTEVEIAAGKSAEITLSFKPLRRSDSRPGDYTVQIAVRRKGQPDLVLRGSVNLLVLPYSGFGMALDKSRLKAGDRFRLFLHNQGSAPLPLTISGRDLSNSHLLIKLVPNRVELAPGQRVVVQGDARPKSTRLFGDARQHSFDLLARSGDASGFLVSTRAYVDEKPPLPAWSVFAFGGLGVAVIGIFLIGLLILLRPSTATPSITQFDVSAERVAQGDPLTLSWMVLDADSVAITLNGAQVMQTDTDENNIQIDTTPFTPGPVTFGLIAMNGDQQVQETRTVEIFVPLRLLSFAYSPNPLVRYVNQTITLRWDVPQASSVRIVGLEGFSTTESIDTAFSASDELSLTGIITTADPLTVTLIAEGAGSTTPLEQTVALDVIDPQCTTAAGGVTLYDGPSTSAQVIGTIPDGGFVTVNAQDPSGAWLRVVLSGGVPGWGQLSAFRCAVTFNTRDLFRELIVPTAVLPATLPPTSTGTPTATLRPTRTLRPTFTPTPAG
ncbi:MAG: FHA domain-containing protein [Chloroflexi bacterium]|nr:FHA domain-containing protein [Chloroflexota bacterium]